MEVMGGLVLDISVILTVDSDTWHPLAWWAQSFYCHNLLVPDLNSLRAVVASENLVDVSTILLCVCGRHLFLVGARIVFFNAGNESKRLDRARNVPFCAGLDHVALARCRPMQELVLPPYGFLRLMSFSYGYKLSSIISKIP